MWHIFYDVFIIAYTIEWLQVNFEVSSQFIGLVAMASLMTVRLWQPICALLLLLSCVSVTVAQDEDDYGIELDDSWYDSDTIPEVDLEGLVANLSLQYTWFKYVGNATLQCANEAKELDTLMMAIEHLHDCLERQYHECASEFANQTGCYNDHRTTKPCGTARMGYRGLAPTKGYDPDMECIWSVSYNLIIGYFAFLSFFCLFFFFN